ncbi:uncharacterized protein ACLA_038320 [Aspergillus clavatus NRRL 1]|uniref:DUF7820 domain-containing protein n=1 Tax=Aspergillus clavatus (strain ATCC 1007 / CBS 513.65 / DSM 816 / NCTC 3887 / NRRL 1 / QM 1276 / 107) TaxID=344612 RepID=A1CKE7_ASPCL|nr:uncharacterized protein ACLA_038320 [Aspergillus clavatus NRRL 1]EAW09621.1 conserved hypothetical protein [Aspergillus clavatus NRRL 1]
MSGHLPSDHSRSLSQSSQSLSRRRSQGPDSDSMHYRSPSGRSSNPNVFSDEYSLDPIDSERSTHTPRSPSIASIASSQTLRSNTVHHQKSYGSVPNDSPEVTENPFGDEARVSFDEPPRRSSLPQKGVEYTAARNSTASSNTAPSIAQRSQSTSSRFSLPPRAMSPYTGATGPSHPYAMYPQVGVSRSPSITTISTVRPLEQPLGDTNAPQHPYAMYPQNVVVEEGMDAPMDNSIIPLGFPGHEQTYQRPIGRADDDVGDLVGPDGHTEQLPPYSRYPDGVVPKEEDENLESGLGAGIATDEVAPRVSQEHPVSEVSSGTLVAGPEGTARTAPNAPPPPAPVEPPVTGVMAFEEKLKRKGKKKACCGLPVWTLVLVGVVIFVVACIAGVIGGVLGAKKAASDESAKDKGPHIVTVTATPRGDATPITSLPTGLPPVPTGEFVIPAGPKNQSKFCVAELDYTSSWSCLSHGKIPIAVHGKGDYRNITFEQAPINSDFSYGAQAPILHATQELSPAYDSNDMNLGPALTFFTLFDKLVILPQDTLSSSAASKRSVSESEIMVNAFHRKQTVEAGDRPWFCWWNGTVIEFFLYMNQTTKDARYKYRTTTTSPPGTIGTPVSHHKKRGTISQDSLFDYPRRIKVEEKRNHPGSPAPYCQQMQVLDNGSIASASPETIQIKEVEPTPTTTFKGFGSATQTYTAKAQYESVCYCASLTD